MRASAPLMPVSATQMEKKTGDFDNIALPWILADCPFLKGWSRESDDL
jgi:hypothetical protein